MEDDKISVIIPVYNVKDYLERCIKSVVEQTYKNLEIIIIDDGSSDGSSEICDKLEKLDKRIKVVHKKNEGVSSARNLGVEYATGKYIGFVDSDDYVEKELFYTLYTNMIKYNAGISMCNYNIVTTKRKNFFQHDEIKDNILCIDSKKTFYNLLNKNYYKGFLFNKLFKTEIVKKIKFDNSVYMCEDLLFVAKYAEQCDKFTFYNVPLYNYVIRKQSAIKSKANSRTVTVIDAYNEIIKIVGKHAPSEVAKYEYSKLLWMNTIIHEYRDSNNDERHNEYIKLYKKIMKSEEIAIKKKNVLFIRTRFYYLYRIINKIYHYIND